MVKICLTSIVKNEGKIVVRMLKSAILVADFVNICDTGSTDDTIEQITTFLTAQNVKFKIHNNVWKDFGHNRTLSIFTARKAFPEADYLLMLDADMELEVGEHFKKEDLVLDSYRLIQYNRSQEYQNFRLLKNNKLWKCERRTHEYYSCLEDHMQCKYYPHLKINDREDGGSKSDKFVRDIRLLTLDMEDHPTCERTSFYLAQSYGSIGESDTCIKYYKKRIALRGWYEEVYISHIRIADEYIQRAMLDEAVVYYLKAHDFRPCRCESLYKLAVIYRQLGFNNLAYMFAEKASKLGTPSKETDALFIDRDAHEWGPQFELGVASYYTNEIDRGILSCINFLSSRDVPTDHKSATEKNITRNNLNCYLNKRGLSISGLYKRLTNESGGDGGEDEGRYLFYNMVWTKPEKSDEVKKVDEVFYNRIVEKAKRLDKECIGDEKELTLSYYLKAFEFKPEVSDNLIILSKICRFMNMNELAYMFTTCAYKNKLKNEDFKKTEADLEIFYELTIVASYKEEFDIAILSCIRILGEKRMPEYLKAQVAGNLKKYLATKNFDPKNLLSDASSN